MYVTLINGYIACSFRKASVLILLNWNMDILFRPRSEKACLQEFANNTCADQPAHPRSLVSAFVVLILESTVCKLLTGEIYIF